MSGSWAEGLAMQPFWGHKATDADCMMLHTGAWGVDVKGMEQRSSPYDSMIVCNPDCNTTRLELTSLEPPSAYCEVKLVGSVEDMVTRMGQTEVTSIRTNAWETVGCQRARECLIKNSIGDSYNLSSFETVRALRSGKANTEYISGPAWQLDGGWSDMVVALVCSRPLPAIKTFYTRKRFVEWPRKDTIEKMFKIRGLLVCASDKLSTNEKQHLQFRYSFSCQEVMLANDMPCWVKQGYIAFKYTMKSVLKREKQSSQQGKVDSFCSYHLKTILLWTLERETTWHVQCPFHFMMILLDELQTCLDSKPPTLSHYFIPAHNLLQNVGKEEIDMVRSVMADIQADPVLAILNSPQSPGTLYGAGALVNGRDLYKNLGVGASIDELLSGLRLLSSEKNIQTVWQLLVRVDLYRYGFYRRQCISDNVGHVSHRPQPCSLADLLHTLTSCESVDSSGW